ncbi:hypothetical protein EX30DRAFT_333758 [Ascodesmis nigricans]|uniref:Acyl-coenzyme A diphosphatase SCS3 n=1 Tax=Ascodesmis nigricans TaxID=341454 RepID=A0A4S2MPS9_9PEZI|nr:hypothetical protein EX30DRAFT_333758 [Ascodesmis nigricans]
MTPHASPTAKRPPRIPTPTDLLLFSLYPSTLLLASIFYHLSPSDAAHLSYFSGKRNILNVVFVKYGWLWTTLVFLLHTSRLQHSSRQKACLRWFLSTLWWVLITQWCFGPPIMDRTFIWTGGSCRRLGELEAVEEMGGEVAGIEMAVTSAACKVAGGQWTGGHDLSGHVFLLTHASLFLWSEVLPWVRRFGWRGVRTGAVVAVLAIWWWMLLMTGVYFHTATEKITGWLAATLPWTFLYGYLLKNVPELHLLLGAPGI